MNKRTMNLSIMIAGFAVITLWITVVHYGLKYFMTSNGFFGTKTTAIGEFFFACLFAPLWEELVFRHAAIQIAKKLTKVYRKDFIIPTVIISSWVFGWGHGEGQVSVLMQGVCGLVFSYVYIKTGYKYWYSVGTHSLWNFSLMFVFPALAQ